MRKKILIFDATLRTKSGKLVPYYTEQTTGMDDDSDFIDQSLHWFHERYGVFQLYRLHQVDDSNENYIYFICEPLKKYVQKSSEEFEELMENPELALA